MVSGDKSGNVILWGDILNDTPVKKTFNWHNHPVSSVCFSAGEHNSFSHQLIRLICIILASFKTDHVYSAGSEKVLVKWHLDETHTKCLLAMDSDILFISSSPDNSTITT